MYYKIKNKMKKINSTFGTWEVITEGDAEGRSIRNLGTFTGHIDEIALHLADKCYYSLIFKQVELVKEYIPKSNNVNIVIDENNNFVDFNNNESRLKEIFKDRNVSITDGNYYKSILLTSTDEKLQEKINEAKKQKILDKLSDEEKEILGLK